jgi:hypothetical protein
MLLLIDTWSAAVADPLLDPAHRHRQGGTAAVQPAREFGDEGTRHRRRGSRHVGDHQHHVLRILLGRLVQARGPLAGQPPVHGVAHHAHGHAPQVLDQRQPQHDRDRPQLAQLERRHRLVGVDEAAHGLGIDAAVAVRDGLHREVVDARQVGGRPLAERRQLAAVAFRQMPPGGADLLLHQVVVVEQPFAGGGDAQLVLHHAGEQGGGFVEQDLVFLQPRQQQVGPGSRMHLVCARQRPAVRLHLLGTEQLGPQRLFGLQRHRRPGAPPAQQMPVQAQPPAGQRSGAEHPRS